MKTDVRAIDQTDTGVYWNDYSHTDELIEVMISLAEQFAPEACSPVVHEYESLRSKVVELESELADELENALNNCLSRSPMLEDYYFGMVPDGGTWGLWKLEEEG